MRVSLVGTRGVPARYGGFETAVDEIGTRLVAQGHDVTVYCRTEAGQERPAEHNGMKLVYLPKLRRRSLETLSHTALSLVHHARHGNADAMIVFNSANSVLLPLTWLRRTPVATHVDGLEWRRGKWGPTGQKYYRIAEALAVRWSDRLIADADGISDYYREEFAADTERIAYGAPILSDLDTDLLEAEGLTKGGYHLVVARFEKENNVLPAVQGYLRSDAKLPLVLVGSAPYASDYTAEIERLAASDPRIRLMGGVWNQDLLDQMYAHAATYIHGHSVGGTNPSLLRAMGAASPVLAYDVCFNREVLGADGQFFDSPEALATLLNAAEQSPQSMQDLGTELQSRVGTMYTWDVVAKLYEALCDDMARGNSQRGRFSGRRRRESTWRH